MLCFISDSSLKCCEDIENDLSGTMELTLELFLVQMSQQKMGRRTG